MEQAGFALQAAGFDVVILERKARQGPAVAGGECHFGPLRPYVLCVSEIEVAQFLRLTGRDEADPRVLVKPKGRIQANPKPALIWTNVATASVVDTGKSFE